MSGFEAQSGQIQSAATHVREVRDQVTTQINQLQASVQQLSASWGGDAARAFDGLMQRWDAQELALRNALSNIADMMDQNRTTYESTEADQQAAMTQVAAALDG